MASFQVTLRAGMTRDRPIRSFTRPKPCRRLRSSRVLTFQVRESITEIFENVSTFSVRCETLMIAVDKFSRSKGELVLILLKIFKLYFRVPDIDGHCWHIVLIKQGIGTYSERENFLRLVLIQKVPCICIAKKDLLKINGGVFFGTMSTKMKRFY